MKKSTTSTHFLKNEHGSVVTIFAVAIVAIISIAALVTDISRKEISFVHLKNVSEAAALAAATELDGTEDGWFKAKRAALAALRQHSSLYGASGRVDNSFAFDHDDQSHEISSAEYDDADPDPAFEGNVGKIGNFTVKVERGVYAIFPGRVDFSFGSLEEGSPDPAPSAFTVLPGHMTANAVRVQTSVDSMGATFSGVFGVTEMGRVSQKAIAKKGNTEVCVAPFAMLACDALRNINPYELDKYETDEIDYQSLCERDGVFYTVADPFGPDHSNNLRQGIVRASKYPRPVMFPYVDVNNVCVTDESIPPDPNKDEWYPNCKSEPLVGLMGVSGEFAAFDEEASAGEVLSVLDPANVDPDDDTNIGCHQVKLGQPFKPLQNNEILTNPTTKNEFKTKVTGLIDSADRTISEVVSENDYWNFPFVRQEDGSRSSSTGRWYYEIFDTVAARKEIIFLSRMDPFRPTNFNYSNPLCHDPSIAPDSGNAAGAREIKIMLIAHGSEDEVHQYCDPESIFTKRETQITPPIIETKPVVVGFMKAYIYDYNVDNLGAVPEFHDPNNPSALDVYTGAPAGVRTSAAYWLRPGATACTDQSTCLMDLNPLGMVIPGLIGSFSPPGQEDVQPPPSGPNPNRTVPSTLREVPEPLADLFGWLGDQIGYWETCVEACWNDQGEDCDPGDPTPEDCGYTDDDDKPCPYEGEVTNADGENFNCGAEAPDPFEPGDDYNELHDKYGDCFVVPQAADLERLNEILDEVRQLVENGQQVPQALQDEINALEQLVLDCCPRKPGARCLWTLGSRGCADLDDPNCWDYPHHELQYGCAGIRFRTMDCNGDQTVFSDEDLSEMRPTLADN